MIQCRQSRCGGRICSSGSRLQSEYWVCSAAIGCTRWAGQIVAGAASDSPTWRTLPACTRPAIERYAQIQGPVDHLDRLAVTADAAGIHLRNAQTHATEAKGGDFGAMTSKTTMLHRQLSFKAGVERAVHLVRR
jgi:hypothetical protein